MQRVGWWSALGLIGAVACSGGSSSTGDGGDDESGGAGGSSTAGVDGSSAAAGRGDVGGGGAGGSIGSSGEGGDGPGDGDSGGEAGDMNGAAGDAAAGRSSAGASGVEGGASGVETGGAAGAGNAGDAGNAGEPAAGMAGQSGDDCEGLECAIVECESGSTTLTGRVLDPAGINPIQHAFVYVPNAPLEPFPEGAQCDRCNTLLSSASVAMTIANAVGEFRLENVPSGQDIPLVVQSGKWRRTMTLAAVPPCVETSLGPELTRLPRNRSEGELPRIALVTGGADALECMMRRIGIDDSEFTTDTGSGSVHLYVGGEAANLQEGAGANRFAAGGVFSHASTLWGNAQKLSTYDALLHSCEGGRYAEEKAPYHDNVAGYVRSGGRLLLSHLQVQWLTEHPDFSGTADYIGVGDDLPEPIDATVDTSTPTGDAFADWLLFTGATATRGVLEIRQGQHSVSAVVPPTEQLLYVPSNPNDDDLRRAVQAFSFRSPADGTGCGRVTLVDFHGNVTYPDGTGSDNSHPGLPFPEGCDDTGASPLGKALEFLLFDMTACRP